MALAFVWWVVIDDFTLRSLLVEFPEVVSLQILTQLGLLHLSLNAATRVIY